MGQAVLQLHHLSLDDVDIDHKIREDIRLLCAAFKAQNISNTSANAIMNIGLSELDK